MDRWEDVRLVRTKQNAVNIMLSGHRTDWGACGQNQSNLIGRDSDLTDVMLRTLKMLLHGVSIVLQHDHCDVEVVGSPNERT